MHSVVIMESWKMVCILALTFCGGYVYGLRRKFINNEHTEADDKENEEEIKKNKESY